MFEKNPYGFKIEMQSLSSYTAGIEMYFILFFSICLLQSDDHLILKTHKGSMFNLTARIFSVCLSSLHKALIVRFLSPQQGCDQIVIILNFLAGSKTPSGNKLSIASYTEFRWVLYHKTMPQSRYPYYIYTRCQIFSRLLSSICTTLVLV